MSSPCQPTRSSAARRFASRATAGLVLIVALCALTAGPKAAAPPTVDVRLVDGSFSHSNSRNGSAILTAAGLKPGDSRAGTVAIANDGTLAGDFTLSASSFSDAPGPNGGALSGRLDLLVEDMTDLGAPMTVYNGKLAAMGPRALGVMPGGQTRTYRFTVSFPDGGSPPGSSTGDNAYQASTTSVQFDWTATGDGTESAAPPTRSLTLPGPADTTPPRLDLWGRRVQRLRRKGVLVLAVKTNESARVNGTGKASGPRAVKRAVRLRLRDRPIAPNLAVQVKLKLSRRGLRATRKALARSKRISVTFTITAVDAAGNRAIAKRRIRLKR